jgi:hypothetical protein
MSDWLPFIPADIVYKNDLLEIKTLMVIALSCVIEQDGKAVFKDVSIKNILKHTALKNYTDREIQDAIRLLELSGYCKKYMKYNTIYIKYTPRKMLGLPRHNSNHCPSWAINIVKTKYADYSPATFLVSDYFIGKIADFINTVDNENIFYYLISESKTPQDLIRNMDEFTDLLEYIFKLYRENISDEMPNMVRCAIIEKAIKNRDKTKWQTAFQKAAYAHIKHMNYIFKVVDGADENLRISIRPL